MDVAVRPEGSEAVVEVLNVGCRKSTENVISDGRRARSLGRFVTE
jgi:hypothetical protein